MTEVDKVFQVAARRIQGLTAKVNHWKQRANELEAALGSEKAARIEAEATLSRALNSWVGQIARTDRDNDLEAQTENKRLRAEVADLRGTFDAVHFALGIKSGDNIIEAIDRLKSSDWFDERNLLKYQVIPDLETQRDGFATQVQDMRNEIAWLRADLRTMSERSNGSEWEQKAAELEELRTELNLVKQERDCAKSEWDRAEERCKALGGEVAEMFSDRQRLKAELAVIKDERNELRAKLEAIEAESRGCYEELSKIRRNALSCEPSAPTLRSHPVKVGEWVKNDNGDVRQVREVYAEYLLTTGWRWAFEHCTPCDPPESTEQMMLRREREFAVKEAADNAIRETGYEWPLSCIEIVDVK